MVLIPNIWFNSLIIPATNYAPLSVIILSGNLCSFQILSWNSLATLSTKVLSIVGTKCAIFVILSYTTRIALYPCTSSNFVIKSAIIWLQDFSGTALGINFPASISMRFLFLWYVLQVLQTSFRPWLWEYLTNFDNLNSHWKPLKRPFKMYQKHLKAISIHWVISRLVDNHQATRH